MNTERREVFIFNNAGHDEFIKLIVRLIFFVHYPTFHGIWQSFVIIGSFNHLMRIISTYVGNIKKSEVMKTMIYVLSGRNHSNIIFRSTIICRV